MIRPTILSAALAASCAFAACAPMAPVEPIEAPATGAALSPCGADALQGLVGQSREDLMRTEILGPVRIIRPGMAVTMDFLPARLNITLDAAERVTRVSCG
ncbi:MAG: I78 family peptidase inhibitor [Pseudomonadota bacterium]